MSSAVINPTTIGQMGANPRASAIAERNAANNFQNSANKAMAGGKHKRLRGGGGIPVAQFSLPYKEQSGPGTGINAQTVDLNRTNTQGAAFAVDDMLGAKIGGFRKRSRRSKIGGNPNWSWGCYSGGKRKTRKHHKSRKHHSKSRKHYSKSRKC
uniref:Uncharacterized protein n=1 Tax=viral metagenome TaxID=1070528 RepID=A0A6C0AQJ1_9ZZZZ